MRTAFKIIPLVLLLVTADLYAQYGVRGGINLPNVSVKNRYNNFNIETENKIGINAGIFLDIAVVEGIQLTSNLTYSSKKITGNYGFVNPGTTTDAVMTVDYLIYSVSGKYNFLDRSAEINPFVFFAPRLNIYLSNDYHQGSLEISQSAQNIISDKITKFGFGVSIGAGFDMKTKSPVTPFLEVQISPDFFNAYDDGYLSFKSNAIEAMVGIRIK